MSNPIPVARRRGVFARRLPSVWTLIAVAIALPIGIPIVAVLLNFFVPTSATWVHLRETVLLEYIGNTLVLLICVACITALVGVGCAWLTATKEFPGRGIFAWVLILPLAAPAYVVAYAYGDLFAEAVHFQSWIQQVVDLDVRLPSIRSLPGAAIVLGFTLYPYVYLLAYNSFSEQAAPMTEAARTLGVSPWNVFFRIALPHARPAIAGGLALALMESAADFGVVEFFGVPTLTNGIFRTWYAMGEHQAAMQLAGWLFLIVAVLVVLEQFARRGLHANPVSRNAPSSRSRLRGWRSLFAVTCCVLPLLFGLLLPVFVLSRHAVNTGDPTFGMPFIDYVVNTVSVATITAILAVIFSMCMTYAIRLQGERKLLRLGVRTATLGYAVPGMVLAIGILGPLTIIDRMLASWVQSTFDVNIGLVMTGSVAALIFVYLARFLTVSFNSVEGGIARIHPNYDDAARSLGSKPIGILGRVHLPLLTPAILTASLLVFVDVVKELPATLILRPFNFETLATRAYRLASDERIAEASTAALLILIVGLVPTIVLASQRFGLRRSTLYQA